MNFLMRNGSWFRSFYRTKKLLYLVKSSKNKSDEWMPATPLTTIKTFTFVTLVFVFVTTLLIIMFILSTSQYSGDFKINFISEVNYLVWRSFISIRIMGIQHFFFKHLTVWWNNHKTNQSRGTEICIIVGTYS